MTNYRLVNHSHLGPVDRVAATKCLGPGSRRHVAISLSDGPDDSGMTRASVPALAIVLCALLLAAATAPFVAALGYDIDVAGSVETPERTVTVDGDDYLVTSIAPVAPGDPVEATVIAPANSAYDLYLYDSDRQIQDTEELAGTESASFATDSLAAGSYVLAVYTENGSIAAVHPVVVAAYRLSVSAPETVSTGTAAEVTVTLEATRGPEQTPDPTGTEVVVTRDGSVVTRVDAERRDDEAYVATLPDDLAAGEYSFYAAVRGEDTVDGRRELLALSDPRSFSVEERTGGGGTGGGEGEVTTTASTTTAVETTREPTASTTESGTATGTATDDSEVTTDDSEVTTDGSEVTTDGPEVTTDGSSGSVITPATTRRTDATDERVPSRGPQLLALLALLAGVAARRRGR